MTDHFFGVTLALVLHIHWFQSGFPSHCSASNMDSQICLEVIQTAIKCPDLKHKTKVNLFLKVENFKKTKKKSKGMNAKNDVVSTYFFRYFLEWLYSRIHTNEKKIKKV